MLETAHGSFCIRFVFSPGEREVTSLGGWAGVNVTPASKEGCFCVRLVFSKGELMTEGGWAGVKVAPASEEA